MMNVIKQMNAIPVMIAPITPDIKVETKYKAIKLRIEAIGPPTRKIACCLEELAVALPEPLSNRLLKWQCLHNK